MGFKYDDTKVREDRRLTREGLDEVSPDHPVRVVHRGGHNSWYNSMAFRLAGVTVDTPDRRHPHAFLHLHSPSREQLGGLRSRKNALHVRRRWPYRPFTEVAFVLIRRIPFSVESIGRPVLSPDGELFALSGNGQIALMPSTGGWPVTLTATEGGKSGLSWSPDNQMVAYTSQGGIWVLPAAVGQPRRLTNATPGSGNPRRAADRAPPWSQKGKWILFVTGRRGNTTGSIPSDAISGSSRLREANLENSLPRVPPTKPNRSGQPTENRFTSYGVLLWSPRICRRFHHG